MSKFKNIEGIALVDFVKEATKNANNHGWTVKNLPPKDYVDIPTALLLCVCELCEAMEAYRDDNFTGKDGFNEEIADTLIRLFHLCGDLNIPIEKVLKEKMLINESREYHHGRRRL